MATRSIFAGNSTVRPAESVNVLVSPDAELVERLAAEAASDEELDDCADFCDPPHATSPNTARKHIAQQSAAKAFLR
jgi:hypothetical protein